MTAIASIKKPTTTIKRKKPRPILEWKLQAAGVRRMFELRKAGLAFEYAGDMNAGRRSPGEATKAKATGLAPGEPDCRIYGERGRLWFIEYKGAKGRLTESQEVRFPLLRALGFEIEIVQAASEADAADATERLVRKWCGVAANDNGKLEQAA